MATLNVNMIADRSIPLGKLEDSVPTTSGESSQFIKGDGSLDDTQYLPLTGGTLSGNLNLGNNKLSNALLGSDLAGNTFRFIGGIATQDTRNSELLPNSAPAKSVSGLFTPMTEVGSTIGTDTNRGFNSGIEVQGWDTTYVAWQLLGPSTAALDDTDSLYWREGQGSTWQSTRKIYDSKNLTKNTVLGIVGTLDIAHGGTGATTVDAARKNLTQVDANKITEDTQSVWKEHGNISTSYFFINSSTTHIDTPKNYFMILNLTNGNQELSQIGFSQPSGQMFRRGANSTGWNGKSDLSGKDAWKQIYDEETLTKTVITNLLGSDTYLSIHGGTLTGSGNYILSINTNNTSNENYAYFKINNVSKASVGYLRGIAFVANEPSGYARIGVTDAGVPQYWPTNNNTNAKTLYHEGNLTKSVITNLLGNTYVSKGEYDNVLIAYHRKADNELVYCTLDKWPARQTAGEIADGVYVAEGDRAIVVAPTEPSSTLYWSSAPVSGGGTTSVDKSVVLEDFNGRENTAAQITHSEINSEEYAAGFCTRYSRLNANGVGQSAGLWWLPSLGEMMMIAANRYKINYALSLIDGAVQMKDDIYWTSSEGNNDRVWYIQFMTGAMSHYPKATYSYNVRPVTSFGLSSTSAVRGNSYIRLAGGGTVALSDYLTKSQVQSGYLPLSGGSLSGDLAVNGEVSTEKLSVSGELSGNSFKVIAEHIASLTARVESLEKSSETKNALTAKTLDLNELYTLNGDATILTGRGVPTMIPAFVGQFYIDITTPALYYAIGNTATNN